MSSPGIGLRAGIATFPGGALVRRSVLGDGDMVVEPAGLEFELARCDGLSINSG
jgi:hypothetical protein